MRISNISSLSMARWMKGRAVGPIVASELGAVAEGSNECSARGGYRTSEAREGLKAGGRSRVMTWVLFLFLVLATMAALTCTSIAAAAGSWQVETTAPTYFGPGKAGTLDLDLSFLQRRRTTVLTALNAQRRRRL